MLELTFILSTLNLINMYNSKMALVYWKQKINLLRDISIKSWVFDLIVQDFYRKRQTYGMLRKVIQGLHQKKGIKYQTLKGLERELVTNIKV